MTDARKMTDEELGRAIVLDENDCFRRYSDIGKYARELLSTPPRTDVPSVEDIAQQMSAKTNYSYQVYLDCARVAHAMMQHLAAPELPPICGMTVFDIQEKMRRFVDAQPLSVRDPEAIVVWCAAIAHSISQPALKVDPDKEAKRLAWIRYQIIGGNLSNSAERLWDIMSETNRDGWRAVAAARGNGDE